MSLYYFDSSALIKNYTNEKGSVWVKAILNQPQGNLIYVAGITKVEVVATFARKAWNPSDAKEAVRSYQQFKADFPLSYTLLDIDTDLIELAVGIAERHALRGYDAVQLAGAISLSHELAALSLPKLTFVSSDTELNDAAVHEGFAVIDPNTK